MEKEQPLANFSGKGEIGRGTLNKAKRGGLDVDVLRPSAVWKLELPRLTGLPVITGSHLNWFAEPVRVAANRCFGHSTRTKVTQVIFFF